MMRIYDKLSDVELTALLKEGDKAAFTELYLKYSGPMYVNVLKMVKDEQLTEELVQDLFTRIWQKHESFTEDVDFRSYLYRIAQNLVFDFYRKLKRDRAMYEKFKLIASEEYSHIEEGLHLKESEALLEQAMAQLSPQQHVVYKLCKIDGLTYKQAAEQMGISTHTVKEYLSKSTQLVKNYMINNLDSSMGLLLLMMLNK
jgi:RNA polymerase sigma-70 factor (family 1)